MNSYAVTNAAELVTLAPLATARRVKEITGKDLGRESGGAWLAVANGKVLATGSGRLPDAYAALPKVDARGALVLPGLVDTHTHLIFAGSRASEFWRRASGATYQEIAAAGGGIRSTVSATRQATDAALSQLLAERLRRWLALGITTVEIKSGYGLSVPEELRLLGLLKQAKATAAQHLAITCLALHAASPEHKSLKAYASACADELLPAVAERGLATAVDAFIEAGYFSVSDVQEFMQRAKKLGLEVRLHADEFSDSGGAMAAATWQAKSADHLQFANADGIKAMAKAGVTATLLPGTSLYTRLPFTNGRRFADAGVPVAVATDFNPGSCQIDNLAMLAGLASVQCGLSPAEAVAGVTYVGAASLGLGDRKGALAPGFDADFLLYEMPDVEAWLADFGRTLPREVWIRGEKVCG